MLTHQMNHPENNAMLLFWFLVELPQSNCVVCEPTRRPHCGAPLPVQRASHRAFNRDIMGKLVPAIAALALVAFAACVTCAHLGICLLYTSPSPRD